MAVDTRDRDLDIATRLAAIAEHLTAAQRDIVYLDNLQRRGGSVWSDGLFDNTTLSYIDPTTITQLLIRLRAFDTWMNTIASGTQTQADVFMKYVRGGE
jgi:hypothetical protein